MVGHFIFSINSKPVVAIPLEGGFKIALIAISCFPSSTLIRKAFKAYMIIRISLFFLAPFKRKERYILPSYIYRDIDIIRGMYEVFLWSPVQKRGRYYIHFLDHEGQKKYFAKVTTKEKDFILMENEKENLLFYSSAESFDVPKVVHYKLTEKYCLIMTENVSENFFLYSPSKNFFPSKVAKEIKGVSKKISIGQYLLSNNLNLKNNFKDLIFNLDKKKIIEVVKVHGDFGSENIFKNKHGDFLIIDWERSKENAPLLTDEIAFWLGKNHKLIRKDEEKAFNKFVEENSYHSREDIVLALYFLFSVDFYWAKNMLERFRY